MTYVINHSLTLTKINILVTAVGKTKHYTNNGLTGL